VRASAGRIVDILQQLVLARPDVIIALEQGVRRILGDLGVAVETQTAPPGDTTPRRGSTPSPPIPRGQSPAPGDAARAGKSTKQPRSRKKRSPRR
jgi:hypothetical protein